MYFEVSMALYMEPGEIGFCNHDSLFATEIVISSAMLKINQWDELS